MDDDLAVKQFQKLFEKEKYDFILSLGQCISSDYTENDSCFKIYNIVWDAMDKKLNSLIENKVVYCNLIDKKFPCGNGYFLNTDLNKTPFYNKNSDDSNDLILFRYYYHDNEGKQKCFKSSKMPIKSVTYKKIIKIFNEIILSTGDHNNNYLDDFVFIKVKTYNDNGMLCMLHSYEIISQSM